MDDKISIDDKKASQVTFKYGYEPSRILSHVLAAVRWKEEELKRYVLTYSKPIRMRGINIPKGAGFARAYIPDYFEDIDWNDLEEVGKHVRSRLYDDKFKEQFYEAIKERLKEISHEELRRGFVESEVYSLIYEHLRDPLIKPIDADLRDIYRACLDDFENNETTRRETIHEYYHICKYTKVKDREITKLAGEGPMYEIGAALLVGGGKLALAAGAIGAFIGLKDYTPLGSWSQELSNEILAHWHDAPELVRYALSQHGDVFLPGFVVVGLPTIALGLLTLSGGGDKIVNAIEKFAQWMEKRDKKVFGSADTPQMQKVYNELMKFERYLN